MEKKDSREYASQVQLLYTHQPIGMVASVVNGLILVGAYWKSMPHQVLLGWYAGLLAITLARTALLCRYRRADTEGLPVKTWEMLFVSGIACSGLVWGSTACFLRYLPSLPHKILTVFVVSGMIAGAASTLSSRRRAYYGFAIPAFFPPILVFSFFCGELHLAMGPMLGLFILLVSISSESMYRVAARSFRLRFENEDLLSSLKESNRQTDLANASLTEEIAERQKAEENLLALSDELERQVRSRTRELEAANRELSAFAHTVAHDLRAPLQTMEGSSKVIEMEYRESFDETGRELVGMIRGAVNRMRAMIDDLLFLSRVTEHDLRREPVDLSLLALEIAGTLKKTDLSRAVGFSIQDNVVARCDRGLVRIVLENIIGNAWKFTAKNPAARIVFGMRLIDGNETYFVEDNGAGFDMAQADKLFRPFQRLHSQKEFGGTGVGLATVQRIVNRHGGKIWARGKRGKGAVFYFTL